MSPELSRLVELVGEAGKLALEKKAGRTIELKSDGSHVTNVDQETELLLRDTLRPDWPGMNFWGEEYGFETMGENGLWLVDPVDGTSNFAHGLPLWGVSVALMDHQGLRLGVIALPELNAILAAERGGGAFWNGEPMPLIPEGEIKSTDLVSVNESYVRKHRDQVLPGKYRLSGAFVIDGAFTVRQYYRALYAVNEKLYDAAATILAGRELGGNVCFLDGTPFNEFDWVVDDKIPNQWGIFPKNCQLF